MASIARSPGSVGGMLSFTLKTPIAPFYDSVLGIAMFFGRFWSKVPILAIAGSLAAKKLTPVGAGTLATHTPLFVVLLIGTILLVAALTFFPALALGPIVEHLQMLAAAH